MPQIVSNFLGHVHYKWQPFFYGKDILGKVIQLISNLPSFISILSLGLEEFLTTQLNMPDTFRLGKL